MQNPISVMPAATELNEANFRCRECGADLAFDPGTQSLKCGHCGTINQINPAPGAVDEEDYATALQRLSDDEPMHEQLSFKCTACAAESVFPPDVTAGACPFCGGPVSTVASSKKRIQPKSLLPFHITREQAGAAFQQWVISRWFAPGELRKRARQSEIHGAYLPAWTYDTNAISNYIGERGEHYWETETYTETENDQTVTKTRQVQRTRWWPASGQVRNSFNDLMVMASVSLPPKLLGHLEPWDLPNLVPFASEYLSGFITESYQVSLTQGFDQARQMTVNPIRRTIESDIGGDEQRITSVNTSYFNVRFRHLLLPVWISAYRYDEAVYRFLVNARTGEVRGERPYSAMKIALLVIITLILVSAFALILQHQH